MTTTISSRDDGARPAELTTADSAFHVTFARAKPRRLHFSLAFRLYYLARKVLPARLLGRYLIDLAWLSRRFALEQLFLWRDAHAMVRPATESFVLEAVEPGDRVIDLGGGKGIAARVAARNASTVLLVDSSEELVAAARELCPPNVTCHVGDALMTMNERGPFDLAILLHFLEHVDDPRAFLAAVRACCSRIAIEVPDLRSDPLNYVRLAEGLPCYNDADHVTEFSAEYLDECLKSAGWRVRALRPRDGVIYALAERPDSE
jgi:2-polyprenyl-3-methyl-5-hydroxy-6-metoxy-1,4-benzoquinol methylase